MHKILGHIIKRGGLGIQGFPVSKDGPDTATHLSAVRK